MVKQVDRHVVVVGLWMVMQDRVVLVQVESYYILKGQSLLFVQPDQFLVKNQRGVPSRQTQNNLLSWSVLLFLLYRILNHSCYLN